MVRRASSAYRRSLLHRNKLQAFRKWVLDGLGYFEMLPSGHEYEVLRIQKYNPAGDEPDIFFHQKLRSQHVTLCEDGEKLVEQWLKERDHDRKRKAKHRK